MKSFVAKLGRNSHALGAIARREATTSFSATFSPPPFSATIAPPPFAGWKQQVRSFSSTTHEEEDKFVAGIRLPKEHSEFWDEALRYENENTFSSTREVIQLANNPKVIIPPFESFNTDLAGKLVALKEDNNTGEKSLLPLSTLADIRSVDAVVFLGLDTADDERGIILGIQKFGALLNNNETLVDKKRNIVAYYPSEQRDERYKNGLLYFANESFSTAHTDTFVSKYIIPRLLNDKGDLLPPDEVKPLVMFGYSLGGREAIMIENSIIDFFQNMLGKTKTEITPYMNKFFRYGVGHAVNWEAPSRQAASCAVTFVAATDLGIKRPQSFMNGVFSDDEPFTQPMSFRHHKNAYEDFPREFLCVLKSLPPSVERNGKSRLNPLGHGLLHYLSAIEQHGTIITAMLQDFMEKKSPEQLVSPLRNSKEFLPDQPIPTKLHKQICTAWATHLSTQKILAKENSNQDDSICNHSQTWRVHFSEDASIMGNNENPWSSFMKKFSGENTKQR